MHGSARNTKTSVSAVSFSAAMLNTNLSFVYNDSSNLCPLVSASSGTLLNLLLYNPMLTLMWYIMYITT